MFENEKLSEKIWGRIQPFFLPLEQENQQKRDLEGVQEDTSHRIEGFVEDKDKDIWKVSGLNERWRLSRYGLGMTVLFSTLSPNCYLLSDRILVPEQRYVS